jgi:carboxypeptidase family protein/TonB-dependent receptor-like protein
MGQPGNRDAPPQHRIFLLHSRSRLGVYLRAASGVSSPEVQSRLTAGRKCSPLLVQQGFCESRALVYLRSFLEELGKNVPEPGGVTKTLWYLLSLFGFVLLVLCLFSGTSLQAQSTATLHGTVTDASGAAVPKATVTACNQATGIGWTTETNEEGNYLIPALPAGVYRIEITREGFQKYIISGLKLHVATSVEQNVRLKVGEMSQQVVITAETPVIDTSTMTVGQVINQATVQDIPLNGRHFVDLTLLIPGTVTAPQNGFLTAPLRGQGAFGVNTAGQREDTVNYMINGINLSDEVQNQITFQPSINTVQEFKVNNSTFSAEYGRNSGAIVNVATRSGTNTFHGDVYEFMRNSALDARNFFNPTRTNNGKFNPQSPFIRNQFGASGGGPIKKDKTFFYLSYEGLRQRQALSLSTIVLSDADRASALTVNNPTVVKLLPLIPRANAGANGFFGSATAPVDIDQGTGDIDFNLTHSDQLHGYFTIQEDRRQEPILQGNTIPGFGDNRNARRQILTLSEAHVFGPSLTNEARVGYNRIHIIFTPNFLANPANFGINNGITTPLGLPQINITSTGLNFGGPRGFPQGRGDTTAAFSDTVRWLHGRHSLSMGGELRRFYNNNVALDIGAFDFANVNSFINGSATRFRVLLGNASDRILQPAWGLYIQDSFKWRPNFTWELGFRYDWNSSPSEARGRFTEFDPISGTLFRTDQPYHTNNHNFEPRLGFAWDPFNDGKTVVRAAYAILTDQPVTNVVTGLSANPPFAAPEDIRLSPTITSITFANAATLPFTLAPATVNPGFDNPYVQSWNLNIQRAVTPTVGVMVGYFGSKGTHLRIARNINQQGFAPSEPFPTVAASSPINPGQVLGNITEQDSGSNSNYNALWASANKRFSHGLQFNASYTFSKSIDYNSLSSQGGVITQDSFNIKNDRGLSDFDVRSRFVMNALYDLPFKGNRFSEGWELGTIVQAQTGNPLTVITGNNVFTGNFTLRPDIVGTEGINGDPSQWYRGSTTLCDPTKTTCTSGFVSPVSSSGATHFGNLGRNTFTGPGFTNIDFSIIKNTKISERFNLQFRTEFFDAFNHPNFGDPTPFGNGALAAVVSPARSSFGTIRSTRVPTGDFGSARQVQFALRLQF